MEELNIVAGFGYDIYEDLNGTVQYSIPFSIYDFKKHIKGTQKITIEEFTEQSSSMLKSRASSIGETRETRQLGASKPLLIGSEKIIILSEKQARYGIENVVDTLFSNAKINDRGIFIVCKGRAEDMLAFNINGYASSSDYIEGLIKNATDYNFVSSEYTLLDLYAKLDSEGENLVLPYLETKYNGIVFTGMAIFKGKKLAIVLPMDEGKIMNMLREKKVKGILSLQEASDKYINYDAVVKRKVKCTKKAEKYDFNIQLDFQGDITGNTLYKDIKKDDEKSFEKLMEKKIEKMCTDFLEKMQRNYKIDCLNLGEYAAAKYGRETGIDWNEEISNADIKVSVNVKIDKIGIGQY